MEFDNYQKYVSADQGVLLFYQDAQNYYGVDILRYDFNVFRVMNGEKQILGTSSDLAMQHALSSAHFKVLVTREDGALRFHFTKSDWVKYNTDPWTYDDNSYELIVEDTDPEALQTFTQGKLGFYQLQLSTHNVNRYDNILVTQIPGEEEPTATPVDTVAPTETFTPVYTATHTSTPTSTWTQVPPTATPTATHTATLTVTPTETATATWSPTVTATPTSTDTPEPTATPTPTEVPEELVSLSGSEVCEDISIESGKETQKTDVLRLAALPEPEPVEVALMRWDMSPLPEAENILEASLVLSFQSPLPSEPFTLEVRRLTQVRPYFEACSWTQYDGIHPWPGGSPLGTLDTEPVIITETAPAGQPQVALDLTELVRQWKRGDVPNHGMGLLASRQGSPLSLSLGASEATDPLLRPVLQVVTLSTSSPDDMAGPTGQVAFNPAGERTNQTAQTLMLSAQDDQSDMLLAGQYRWSLDNTIWQNWANFTGQIDIDLPQGDGLKRVYVEFKDEAGNVSFRPATAEVVLDQTPPSGQIQH
jgi:hypothetical protein